jgi:hypothetical protein
MNDIKKVFMRTLPKEYSQNINPSKQRPGSLNNTISRTFKLEVRIGSKVIEFQNQFLRELIKPINIAINKKLNNIMSQFHIFQGSLLLLLHIHEFQF